MYLGKLESKFDSTRLNQHQNRLVGVSERPVSQRQDYDQRALAEVVKP